MNNTIQKEILIPQPPAQVWRALTQSETLAEWMYPNDFEPSVGHHFTFQVPPNAKVNFDGLTVRCEVLECTPPLQLVFSWSVAGPVANTLVSFRLEPDGEGTRLFFEHSGFDLSQPMGNQAFKGAEYGWAKMLAELAAVVATPSTALSTERVFAASSVRIFAAFEQPDQLAQWWGPDGFTNTFERFEFKPGGRWVCIMHGPNGADYPNESVFQEIQTAAKIVIEHVSPPWFTLTVTLTAQGNETQLSWVQQFDTPEVAAHLSSICVPANEQNLDRLQALLAKGSV